MKFMERRIIRFFTMLANIMEMRVEKIYMYNDLAHGLMFVVGTEDIAIMKERILNSSFTLIKYQRAQSTCCSFIDIKI